VIVDPVTARYATALHNLARRTGAMDAISRDVAAIAAEIGRPATRALIFNPRVEREAKRAQLSPVLATANPLTRNLVNLLLDKNREEVLKGLAAGFRRLVLDEHGTVDGFVESPRPLAPAEITRIADALAPKFGKKLALANRLRPDLVAGARVIAGNRMLDCSVQGRLESLRRRMMDVRLPTSA